MTDFYQKQIDWLFNQFPVFQKVGQTAFKPTLENTEALLDHFGIDLSQMNFVHVAGTNGKGTVSSIMASTFTESGLKTGLFTSPHIHDFRERIRINGEMIEEEEVSNFISAIQDHSFSFKPSFFEISWVMSLYYFQKQNCDIIVVETGLGGRLDATNVITPLISIITNIGLDHTDILGNTLGEIAMEKAGVIKDNVPVVIGQAQKEICSIFQEKAKKHNALIHLVEHPEKSTVFEMNERIAKAALIRLTFEPYNFEGRNFMLGLKRLATNTGFKGRMQIIKEEPKIIADAAHNIDGILRMLSDIKTKFGEVKVHAIYGATNDKDLEKIFSNFPDYWTLYFTEFKGKRSHQLKTFERVAKNRSFTSSFHQTPLDALRQAQTLINKDDIILVFGSFYLLEEII